ncbi:hypothetical protein ACQP0C_31515 [Nocardia sp. CA-129566]|uniref:hypothetical protein n=1 Tax=Nocardia sp. CA-129566 TaxID=3239976 RepID=UPI003D95CF50
MSTHEYSVGAGHVSIGESWKGSPRRTVDHHPGPRQQPRAGRQRVGAWILLFLIAPWLCLLIWWLKPDSQPVFVQQLINLAKQYPKRAAWLGVASGIVAFIANIAVNPPSGLFGLLVAGWCTYLLIKWRRHKQADVAKETAARADAQHQAYLRGEDWGIYGNYEPQRL